jgi:hypothetical protein
MELARAITASAPFRKSARLREFLLFIVEHRDEALTEHRIGREVFGRGAGFLPVEDSIVRTAARQLRAKLKEYYEEEGREQSLLLEVPKGGYVPVFTPHEIPVARRPNLISALIEGSPQPVRLIASDAALMVMGCLAQRPFTPQEYASHELAPPAFEDPRMTQFWHELAISRLTSFGDLAVIQAVFRAAGGRWDKLLLRHARDIGTRDFQFGNSILIGGLVANPWTALFEAQCNFRVHVHYPREVFGFRAEFVNCRPLSGEPARFGPADGAGAAWHARLALLPNPSGSGRVLLITGLNAAASEAAGEYAGDPEAALELLKLLGLTDLQRLPALEVLLETEVVDSVPQRARVVAFRASR